MKSEIVNIPKTRKKIENGLKTTRVLRKLIRTIDAN